MTSFGSLLKDTCRQRYFLSLKEKHDEFLLRELVRRWWKNQKSMVVYQELCAQVRDAVISLIDQEREGEQIDRALLKNVLDIFVEIGMGQMDYYENDFEAIIQVEECLKQEKDRVLHYLHPSSETKLLEKVQHELLSVCATSRKS